MSTSKSQARPGVLAGAHGVGYSGIWVSHYMPPLAGPENEQKSLVCPNKIKHDPSLPLFSKIGFSVRASSLFRVKRAARGYVSLRLACHSRKTFSDIPQMNPVLYTVVL